LSYRPQRWHVRCGMGAQEALDRNHDSQSPIFAFFPLARMSVSGKPRRSRRPSEADQMEGK